MTQTTTEETTRDKIFRLYSDLKSKNSLYQAINEKYGAAVSTIRINWFHYKGLPKDKEEGILELIEAAKNE